MALMALRISRRPADLDDGEGASRHVYVREISVRRARRRSPRTRRARAPPQGSREGGSWTAAGGEASTEAACERRRDYLYDQVSDAVIR